MTSKAKDRFPNYESICLQCGATIWKPAKVKQLSDEEIAQVFDKTFKVRDFDDDFFKFARAIIKEITE